MNDFRYHNYIFFLSVTVVFFWFLIQYTDKLTQIYFGLQQFRKQKMMNTDIRLTKRILSNFVIEQVCSK